MNASWRSRLGGPALVATKIAQVADYEYDPAIVSLRAGIRPRRL